MSAIGGFKNPHFTRGLTVDPDLSGGALRKGRPSTKSVPVSLARPAALSRKCARGHSYGRKLQRN